MAKNLNINRTQPDTTDNVRYINAVPSTDYKGITILVIGSALVSVLVVAILLTITGAMCWITGTSECTEQAYILRGYIGLLGVAGLIAVASLAPALYQKIQNMAFIQWRGVVTHRDDARSYAQQVIEVARTSAASEATAGLDTLQHEVSNTSNSSTPSTAPSATPIDAATPAPSPSTAIGLDVLDTL